MKLQQYLMTHEQLFNMHLTFLRRIITFDDKQVLSVVNILKILKILIFLPLYLQLGRYCSHGKKIKKLTPPNPRPPLPYPYTHPIASFRSAHPLYPSSFCPYQLTPLSLHLRRSSLSSTSRLPFPSFFSTLFPLSASFSFPYLHHFPNLQKHYQPALHQLIHQNIIINSPYPQYSSTPTPNVHWLERSLSQNVHKGQNHKITNPQIIAVSGNPPSTGKLGRKIRKVGEWEGLRRIYYAFLVSKFIFCPTFQMEAAYPKQKILNDRLFYYLYHLVPNTLNLLFSISPSVGKKDTRSFGTLFSISYYSEIMSFQYVVSDSISLMSSLCLLAYMDALQLPSKLKYGLPPKIVADCDKTLLEQFDRKCKR